MKIYDKRILRNPSNLRLIWSLCAHSKERRDYETCLRKVLYVKDVLREELLELARVRAV